MLIRRFFLWLLMLAIPVQGMAASTMLLCGPEHHRQQQSAQAMHEHSAHGHGEHGNAAPTTHDAQPGGHGMHGAHATHDPLHIDAGGDAGASADPTGLSELSTTKCSACASCCSALALLGPFLSLAVAERHESRTPALTTDFEPVFIDGPDKPPRAFLA